MLNPKDIAKHELIGLEIEIVESKNKALIGLKGRITDETKNTITIDDGKERKIMKSQIKMKTAIGNKEYEIDGRILVGRPEDRIKKQRKIR
ncbi:MAG: ribonuclease P protein subunit [archaeon]